jgi:hypothetical protein
VCFFVCSAPQEVSQIVVDVISNSSIQVQWGPPARANGILTHYIITVFSHETEFDFSAEVNSSAAEVITISGLRMLITQSPPPPEHNGIKLMQGEEEHNYSSQGSSVHNF